MYRRPGYPVTPTFKVPPSPDLGIVKALPTAAVANPGQYFEGIGYGYSGVGGTEGYGRPDAVICFHSPQYYNCIEVDIETVQFGTAYVVPEKISMMLDDLVVPTFLSSVVANEKTEIVTHNSLPNNAAEATEYFRLIRQDFVNMPLRTQYSPGLGDPATSASRAESRVWRIYGAKPFRYAFISYWINQVGGNVPNVQYQPSFRLRVHYDPAIRTLRSI